MIAGLRGHIAHGPKFRGVKPRNITVEIPADLLEKAQQNTGAGVTQTVRAGLQLIAASRTYAELRSLRGKVRFSRTAAELNSDRGVSVE